MCIKKKKELRLWLQGVKYVHRGATSVCSLFVLPCIIKEYKQKPQSMEQNSFSTLHSSEKFLGIPSSLEAKKTIYIKIVVVITKPMLYPVLTHHRKKTPQLSLKSKASPDQR